MLRRRFIRRRIKKEWIFIAVACISIILSIIFGSASFMNNNIVNNTAPGSMNNLISGGAVTSIKPVQADREKKQEEKNFGACSAIICFNEKLTEVLCSLSYDDCCSKYSDCRIVKCDEELESCESEEEGIEEPKIADACPYEYHDCRDGYEEVICKGDFESCSDSFDYCSCGTTDNAEAEEIAVPDVDSSQAVDCISGVFVCERQTFTMSGELAVSRVTCKSSFEECSLIYGNCHCGDSSLTDFPTDYVGTASSVTEEDENLYENQECNFMGRTVPCYMVQGNCSKSKNTCDKGNGIWITCKDKFSYCHKKYDGRCLCGVEIISSGVMVTKEE